MDEVSDAGVLGRFISMGGNCEFGFAQRMFRSEPMDLLRWGQTDMPVLLHMLRDRFAHIGDPAAMELSVVGGEYILENRYYKFKWHTFAMETAMSRDRILKRETARLPRQADMLLDEMQEGHRILVRLADHGVREDGLDAFVNLCGRLGPSQILFVSRDPARAGTAERVGPTLLRGYVEAFADGANVPGTTRGEMYLKICRNVLKIVDGD
jgi:hypothetical protein